MGRILGVDYGARRIGFAVSDPTQIIASADEVVTIQNPGEAANRTAGKVRRTGAEEIVVGLPRNMDGSEGASAQKAREFVELLRKKTHVPVAMWDERLSTKSAHDILIEAGTRREKRKGLVDKIAAQIMLQNYLDAKGGEGGSQS
ncbi:MAG: Holliday junction resolvase RuvX [bacterium]